MSAAEAWARASCPSRGLHDDLQRPRRPARRSRSSRSSRSPRSPRANRTSRSPRGPRANRPHGACWDAWVCDVPVQLWRDLGIAAGPAGQRNIDVAQRSSVHRLYASHDPAKLQYRNRRGHVQCWGLGNNRDPQGRRGWWPCDLEHVCGHRRSASFQLHGRCGLFHCWGCGGGKMRVRHRVWEHDPHSLPLPCLVDRRTL